MRWNPIWWLGWVYGAVSALFRHGQFHGHHIVCAHERAIAEKMNPAAAQESSMQQHQGGRAGGIFLVVGNGAEVENVAQGHIPPTKMN